jgi:hypothetical protein
MATFNDKPGIDYSKVRNNQPSIVLPGVGDPMTPFFPHDRHVFIERSNSLVSLPYRTTIPSCLDHRGPQPKF